jgi:hypothetical protein
MNPLKSTLVGIGLSIALATVASAQSMTPEVTDGIAKVVPGDGSYLDGNGAHATLRTRMKHATRLKAGSIIYRSGSSLDAVRAQIGGEAVGDGSYLDGNGAHATLRTRTKHATRYQIGGEAVEDAWQGWRRNF